MKNIFKAFISVGFLTAVNANATLNNCYSEQPVFEKMFFFIDVLKRTSSVKIKQKIQNSDTYLTSVYSFEVIDLNSTDFILLTSSDVNNKPQMLGMGYNIYFGYDANSEELDYYNFQPSRGFDSASVASFKWYSTDKGCIFKTEPNLDGTIALLKILSNDSFSLSWVNESNGSEATDYPSMIFKR